MTSRRRPRPSSHAVLDGTRPLVFAHRGGAALRPENTMAAFEHGLALGADGLELDVQFARDRTIVVCHDETLDRTTDATGLVRDRTASELAEVDAAWHFECRGARFRGQRIGVPRLRDVLEGFPAVPLVIELKGSDIDLAAAAVTEVREAGALRRVCFGSFSGALLRAAREADLDVVTSATAAEIQWALYASWVHLPPWRPAYHAFQVPEVYGATRVVSPAFVRTMRRAGLPVQVWTVDDPADMRRLLRWGVHALITDRPDLAAEVVRTFTAGR
jgi:glycerophosphoryl diester phosphodiesterase